MVQKYEQSVKIINLDLHLITVLHRLWLNYIVNITIMLFVL